jgi:hypothetical protein
MIEQGSNWSVEHQVPVPQMDPTLIIIPRCLLLIPGSNKFVNLAMAIMLQLIIFWISSSGDSTAN